MSSVPSDLRHAARRLWRAKGTTMLATLTLGFGVGANAILFTLVNGVLLTALPYDQPERLAALVNHDGQRELVAFTHAGFEYFRDNLASAQALGAYAYWFETFKDAQDPELLVGATVSSGLFEDVLRAPPLLGRGFTRAEDEQGAPHVIILSHAAWQGRFGGDPAILGRTLPLESGPAVVIGVMPADFTFPSANVRFWVPLARFTREPGYNDLRLVARLHDGISIDALADEATAVGLHLRQEDRRAKSTDGTIARSLLSQTVGSGILGTFALLGGAVAILLLIACSNLANLLLARTALRRSELAVRRALGASPGRIRQVLLSESLLLAVTGGLVGVAITVWGVAFLLRMPGAAIPRSSVVTVDARVVAFTFALSLVAAVVTGLVSTLPGYHGDLSAGLRSAGRGTSGRRLHGALIVGQVAVTFALLVGSGLMVASLWNLQSLDLGFEPEAALVLRLTPAPDRFPSNAQQVAYYDQLLGAIEELPEVSTAGGITFLPLEGWSTSEFRLDGREDVPVEELPSFEYDLVTPSFFRAMGTPILRGRELLDSDRAGGDPVVVVNDTLARQVWPEDDPIGRRVGVWNGDRWVWSTVVGVAADIRQQGTSTVSPKVFIPHRQHDWDYALIPLRIVVRTRGADPVGITPDIRALVRTLDPDPPALTTQTLGEHIDPLYVAPRFNTLLLLVFAVGALSLSSVGLYTMIAFDVASRTREIGVRMALGARSAEIRRHVLRSGLELVGTGVAIGCLGAALAARLLQGLLYGVSGFEPRVWLTVCAIVVGVAALAAAVPGVRASRVDPQVALNDERPY